MRYLVIFTQTLLIVGVLQVFAMIWFGEYFSNMLPAIATVGPQIFGTQVLIGFGCLITLVIQTLARLKHK